ncbi:MAG TPA: phage tail protein [Bryobacteraceae bacterium]|nr:phage tail protein [Bryobacteraceae bacterium]
MPIAGRKDPFNATNFKVEIDGIASSAFLSVTGIEADVTAEDYRDGNDKVNSARKLPGEAKFSNITLKRGLTADLSLWQWMQQTLDGKLTRKNVAIVMLTEAAEEVLRFTFVNAWPVKWSGPSLNAETSDVAIETLELAHEGLSVST